MYFDGCFTTYAKWILAGEHAVLRGYPALVFPLKQKKLDLHYHNSNQALSFEISWPSSVDINQLFYLLISRACELLDYPLNFLTGSFYLSSNITIGAGMGASAALSVALTRWFIHQSLLVQEKWYAFAKQLEHLFHGQSSGLDIAGVAASQGIYFRQGEQYLLNQQWQPCWYLSFSNQKSTTKVCVEKVHSMHQKDSKLAIKIDQQMRLAVIQAQTALANPYNVENLMSLAQAINLAGECFVHWGLIDDKLYQYQQTLIKAGALATKPTGSGMGGYVLSLWEKPPANDNYNLIALT